MAMVVKRVNPVVNALIIFTIVAVIIVTFLPYFWMLLSSFKTRADLLSTTRNGYSLRRWRIFPKCSSKGIFSPISIIRSSSGWAGLILSLVIGIPCAYAISRFQFPAKGHFFFYILSTRMAPPVAFALPMYILFSRLGILGTHMAVILAHTTLVLSFVVWIMKGFFDDMPIELEQAAMTDGYTLVGAFWHVILPVVKPGMCGHGLIRFHILLE